MADTEHRGIEAPTPALPPDLDARLSALEAHAQRADFDMSSWFWMILLGIAVPAILLLIGWWI
jgi:hypothetical protein